MAFWNKIAKKKDDKMIDTPEWTIPPRSTCDHKWRDFPWYITFHNYSDTHSARAEVIEPYCCIWCKQRNNKVLQTFEGEVQDVLEEVEKLKSNPKTQIEDICVVEDMINDFQLVDRDYLRVARQCLPKELFKGMNDRAEIERKIQIEKQ